MTYTRTDIHATRTLDEVERDAYINGDAVRAALAARLIDTETDLEQNRILCDELIDALNECLKEFESFELLDLIDDKLRRFIERIV